MRHPSTRLFYPWTISSTGVLWLISLPASAHETGLLGTVDELLIVLPGLLIAALGLVFAITAQNSERRMRYRFQALQSEHDALSASSSQLQSLVEQAGYGLWQTDHNQLTCYLNSPMRRLLAVADDYPLHQLKPANFISPATEIEQDTCDPYEAVLVDCHNHHHRILVINTPTGSGMLRTIIDISGRHGKYLRHRAA